MKKKWKNILLFSFCGLILCGGLSYFVMTYRIHQIVGTSMENAYYDGQWVLVNRKKAFERYSVVSFSNAENTEMFIKRILGVPGDAFILVGNRLILNIGNKDSFQMTYSFTLSNEAVKELIGKKQLPEDAYFVIGDHVEVSKDSRAIGLIYQKEIEGVVQFQTK